MTGKAEADNLNKPDFRHIDDSETPFEDFPAPVLDEFRVHIDPRAHARMKAHAETTDEVELCGILVGRVYRDASGPFLKITDVIEGEGANNYGAQVTFTHQTWTHINQVMDSLYPDQRIVGWYHTHPGFGVFLSKMDMFIQENFFQQPYQVAIVLETKAGVEGCFSWSDGRPEPLKRYWVGSEERELARGESSRFEGDFEAGAKSLPEEESGGRPWLGISPLAFRLLIVFLIFLALVSGLFWGRMLYRDRMEDRLSTALEAELYSLVERTSLSAMAAQDFFDLHHDLTRIELALAREDRESAVNGLKRAEQLAAGLESHYSRRSIFFQESLRSLLLKRKAAGLKQEPDRYGHPPAALDDADLYLVRLAGLLGGFGRVNPGNLPETNRQNIKIFLDRILALHPEIKNRIKIMLPGLIEYYYPGQDPGPGSTEKRVQTK